MVPEKKVGFGVISTPFSSRALRMSMVATMLAIASQLLLSARYCPGHTLRHGHVQSAKKGSSMLTVFRIRRRAFLDLRLHSR